MIGFKVILVFLICACEADVAEQPGMPDSRAGSSRLSELLRSDGAEGFPRVTDPREFRFPADHGPHDEYRNEWWYFTGNLDAEDGRRFGFELTIFRFLLAPEENRGTGSAWQSNQVYIGHFALTDVERKQFHVVQRYSRGSAGLAGAESEPFRVWLDDWSISEVGTGPGGQPVWRLRANDTDIAVDLNFVAEKPIVLNGDNGLSQKSAEVGNASYYYSIPRLGTSGTVRVREEMHSVSGITWLDREWGSSALARDQQGWDWFALQLSDGSDLMFYTLRSQDGSTHPNSSGTWIDAAGNAHHLTRNDVVVEVKDYWDSERGGRYPSAWEIGIPGKNVTISVVPVLEDQELITNVRYWEGAVDVSGNAAGQPIHGRGYFELTGYAN